jgi:polyphosphate kinase 2|tara:strand:+ start:621 stop:1454 length:834 start_codon:yes stop_codon:yes gene_type:complete
LINFHYKEYKKLSDSEYLKEKNNLQIELLKLQESVIKNQDKLAIIFEGRDAAGKGSTIKRFVEYLIPKQARVVQLGIPTNLQNRNWFPTYEKLLPKNGEIVFFDRSYYSRALIQPTMNYCTRSQYNYFLKKVNDWEQRQINNGVKLIKFYLSIEKENQSLRFKLRETSKLKYWKLSDNDLFVSAKWDIFTYYKERMFEKTSTKNAPWIIINSNNKQTARLNAMRYVLNNLDYTGKVKLKNPKWSKERKKYNISIYGVDFKQLTKEQFDVLYEIKANL